MLERMVFDCSRSLTTASLARFILIRFLNLAQRSCALRSKKNFPVIAMSRIAAALFAVGFQASPLHAADVDADLASLSLEQLTSIKVTSVSRRAEPLATAAASIYVITNDDIRRSGARSLPEALRLAPNLQVARLNAREYAISARGFNSTAANKLQVQLDGRSLYTPLFSGVLWDAQDVMLADVDRIEVISGPGTTLWGSNAVNGVINIITRAAKETQGGLVWASTGSQQHDVAARYGGELTNGGNYRVYTKRDNYEFSERANGVAQPDAWQKTQAGFRVDAANGLTIQGDAYDGSLDPTKPERQTISGANLLARWNGMTKGGSRQTVRFIYDQTHRHAPGTFEEQLRTYDLLLQQDSKLSENQNVIFGGGYRVARDQIVNSSVAFSFLPANDTVQWISLFAQDDITVTKKTRVSLGARAEHNSYTNWEFLPNLRLTYAMENDQVIWAGLSRSVRAPSRIDRGLYAQSGGLVLAGSADFGSEVVNTAELGYRAQATTAWSYSLTAFYERFRRLRALRLVSISPFTIGFNNGTNGHTYGVEGWTTYRLNRQWRFDAGFVRMLQRYSADPGSALDNTSMGDDPKTQWQARTTWDVSRKLNVSLSVRHVTALRGAQVPSYTAFDISSAYKILRDTSLTLSVLNAQGGEHREFGTAATGSEFGPEAYIGLSVVF
ncbi:MAG: hypothetical protein JWL63_1622 [Rhodocyclales bacterium]|nr:hypothetical protein [Rhodocyclales bacterium]